MNSLDMASHRNLTIELTEFFEYHLHINWRVGIQGKKIVISSPLG
jgi:hypothetical protein